LPALALAQAEGRVRIVGRGLVEVAPDFVTVRVGISNKAPSPTAALDQNSAIARKIIDFAKKFGIEERDAQTDAVNLSPTFKTVREPSGATRQEPDGYAASNAVRVKLSDLSRLGTFMRQVLDQGATNIGGVQFGLSSPEKATDEARLKAVEDAVRQARQLADAAGIKLGKVLEIVHPPRAEYQAANSAADMALRRAPRAAVPIEAGTLEVGTAVEITWAIE
jgi:uncharacterized protein YggE